MGMNMGGGGKRGQPTPDVNVTPLVDVTLVVLIIFMVMTPLMTKTFWLNLPDKPEADKRTSDAKSEPLVMTLDKEGVIRINKTILKEGELFMRLPRMLASQKRKVLYFDAHDEVTYGAASALMDRARMAGARSIAILTKSVVK